LLGYKLRVENENLHEHSSYELADGRHEDGALQPAGNGLRVSTGFREEHSRGTPQG
jgi:hypothetical protein